MNSNNSRTDLKKLKPINKEDRLLTDSINLSIIDNLDKQREHSHSVSDEEFDTYACYKTIFRKDRQLSTRQRLTKDLKIPIGERMDIQKITPLIEVPLSKISIIFFGLHIVRC